jgi:hypothetical protein
MRYVLPLLLALLAGSADKADAMSSKLLADQIILEGPVLEGDGYRIGDIVKSHPELRTVVLRNSPGGDIPSGFYLGELFRTRGLTTAVSGFCYSSCSRMFLGGKARAFTDDYPVEATNIGFHGHYDRDGRIDLALVYKNDLKGWIIKYSDGKADPALIDRWIRLPVNNGMLHFYHPTIRATRPVSAYMCQGTEPSTVRILGCEQISKAALDLGIVTGLDFLHSADQQEIRNSYPAIPPRSDFAAIDAVERVPVPAQGQAEYRRFLDASPPRAFAIAPGKTASAWNSGSIKALGQALSRCAERAKSPCELYAVDDEVVWRPAGH